MVRKKISRKAHPAIRFLLLLTFIGIVVSLVFLFYLYRTILLPSIDIGDKREKYFYIYTGDTYPDVINKLVYQEIVTDKKAFEWLAGKKKYSSHIYPGRYKLTPNMTNNELLNMLRSGKQSPVMVIFNNIRTLEQLAGVISKQFEPDSLAFINVFSDPSLKEKYGFTKDTFPAMFIPNSYEFYWNTSAMRFVERMHSEYLIFWAKGRSEKAEKIGLTPVEVSTLASIVDQESIHDDENARIAGVFMNRLKAGIPLQSDPTVIFAWKDFSIRRVLNKHKKINSPYNTYKFKNLPPGPISIPSINAIDGVLNYERSNYLYFCAKDDFSGYHNFARTLSQHLQNARLYQKALNQRRIFN